MKAKDIMSADVVTIGPDDTVHQAAQLMLLRRISGLPVVDSFGALVGMITEGDFLRRVETGTTRRRARWIELFVGPGLLAKEYTHAAGRIVREVMSHGVVTASEDASLGEIVALMEKHGIKRIPIVRENKIVGIVTRQNLLRAAAGPATLAPVSESDTLIATQFRLALQKQPWSPPMITIDVLDGMVKLRGVIHDERQREALIVLAENLPGVRSVEDQLTFIKF